MFFINIVEKKTIIELHHDLNTESRIVRFLVKNFKFLNSRYLNKAIAITNGIKDEFINKKYMKKNKIIVLPSGSSLKNSKIFLIQKAFKIGYFGSIQIKRC